MRLHRLNGRAATSGRLAGVSGSVLPAHRKGAGFVPPFVVSEKTKDSIEKERGGQTGWKNENSGGGGGVTGLQLHGFVSPDVGLRRAVELQAEHDDVLAGVDGGVAVAGSVTIQVARGKQKAERILHADTGSHHRLDEKAAVATPRPRQRAGSRSGVRAGSRTSNNTDKSPSTEKACPNSSCFTQHKNSFYAKPARHLFVTLTAPSC